MNDRGPAFLLREPQLVELALRRTVRDTLAARRMGLARVDPRSFGNHTLATLRACLAARTEPFDELGVHELEAATLAATSRFLRSALARRLFALPNERVRTDVGEADAAVLDERGLTHLVRVECCAGEGARRELARQIAASAPAPDGRVHLFSLRDGRFRTVQPAAAAPVQSGETARRSA